MMDVVPVDDEIGLQFAEAAYRSVARLRTAIGMSRLQLGAQLCLVHDSGIWRGKTHRRTFRGFLTDEGLDPRAAQQYMQVARVFVLQLMVDAVDLRRIARASMRTLSKAAGVVTPENVEQVVEIIATLPRPEALEELAALAIYEDISDTVLAPAAISVPTSRPVGRILDQVADLTFEQKADLYRKLGLGPTRSMQ